MVEITTLNLRPEDARLLVIDAENDVCHIASDYNNSEYAIGKKRDVTPIQEAVNNGIIPFLKRARDNSRDNRLAIGFIQSIYKPGDYLDVSPKWLTENDEDKVNPETGKKDPDWRIRIYKDMPQPKDKIFKKDTQNPSTYQGRENGLDGWLEDVPYVLVTGFVSYGCVNEGVNVLLERHHIPVVLEDCIGASAHRKIEHEKILNWYKSHGIIQVVKSINVKLRIG